ncbi:MAG: ATP-binding protein [Actinomycetota bacterium]
MSEDGTGIDQGVLENHGAPRPLAVARTAVARAAEELHRVADEIAAVEHDDERTEARIREADERAAAAARALEDAMHRVSEAERRAEYAERLVTETQDVVRAAEEQRAAAEELARMADERSRSAEDAARSAAERVAEAEWRAAAADLLVTEADARAAAAESRGGGELERQLAEVIGRAEETEERLEIEMARTVELSRRLDEASRTATVADQRADEADERAHVSLERAKKLEAEVDGLRKKLDDARQAPPVTVIVDEARTALQEAVAAEVRRPLSSIMGLTLALKHHDPNTTEGIDMVRQLSMNARKLDRLIAEYLELDKLIDGTLQPNRRRTDLTALVRRVVEESPDLANIDVRVEASHATAAVDPILAEQMIEALVANAGRRTPPGGSITVRVAQDAAGASIVVEDAGERVPPALREALLDPAQLLRSGAPKGGTGLILMSRLAQIHRGRATVEERPDGGAAFRVFLPAVAETAEDPPAAGARPTLEDGAIAI